MPWGVLILNSGTASLAGLAYKRLFGTPEEKLLAASGVEPVSFDKLQSFDVLPFLARKLGIPIDTMSASVLEARIRKYYPEQENTPNDGKMTYATVRKILMEPDKVCVTRSE